jgi:hypothetical protein
LCIWRVWNIMGNVLLTSKPYLLLKLLLSFI